MTLTEAFNDAEDSDKNFMVFYREAEGEKLLVIHNVSNTLKTYTLKKPSNSR